MCKEQDEVCGSALSALREALSEAPNGPVSSEAIRPLLIEAWCCLEGSGAAGIHPDDLLRATDFEWRSPCLVFEVERHGAFNLGSSRAERQGWTVDLERGEARHNRVGYRQLVPAAKRLDTRSLAENVATQIAGGVECSLLRWISPDEVVVKIGEIIPGQSAVKATLQDRRKRFRRDLVAVLTETGWSEVRANRYRP